MQHNCVAELNFPQDWDPFNEIQNNLPTQLLECGTSRAVSEEGTMGVRNESPQDVPLPNQAGCSEPRATLAAGLERNFFPSLNYLEELELGAF